MIEALLFGIPLGITIAFAAGPIFFVVIETSITRSKTSAAMIVLGAFSADVIFIVIAYNASQTFLKYLEAHPWVSVISGLGIAVFGAISLLKAKTDRNIKTKLNFPRKRLFFLKGFAINFLNIGVLFFWIATTIAVGSRLNYQANHMLLFYCSTFAVLFAIEFFKIYFANRFRKKISPKLLKKVESIIGIILIVFGLFIAIRAYWV